MSERMKGRPTKNTNYVDIILSEGNSNNKKSYKIVKSDLKKVFKLLEKLQIEEIKIDEWEEATSWEELSRERIEKYKKAGIVLRGARYREGLSQKELAKLSNVSQNNISNIENGKRSVGEKVAKRLAAALSIDYTLLIKP